MRKTVSPPIYAVTLVACTMAMAILSGILKSVIGFGIPAAANSVFPILIAAWLEGLRFARLHGTPPADAETWAAARVMAITTFVVFAILGLVGAGVLAGADRLSDPALFMQLGGIAAVLAGTAGLAGFLVFRAAARHRIRGDKSGS